MPEPQPNQRIDDPRIAEEVAYAEKPFRDTQHGIGKLIAEGYVEVGPELHQLRLQADKAANEAGTDKLRELEPRGFDHDVQENSEQKRFGKERFLELLDKAPVIVSTWFTGSKIPRDMMSTPSGQFKELFNGQTTRSEANRLARAWENTNDRDSRILKQFAEAGVPEVVTFQKYPDDKYRDVVPGTTHPDEAVVRFAYETVTRSRQGAYQGKLNDYSNAYGGRSGNYIFYSVFLPESQADELRQAITDNPELTQEITTAMMTEYFGATAEEWQKMGPDYAKWRELDGGVSRVAIRDRFDQSLQDSTIIQH